MIDCINGKAWANSAVARFGGCLRSGFVIVKTRPNYTRAAGDQFLRPFCFMRRAELVRRGFGGLGG